MNNVIFNQQDKEAYVYEKNSIESLSTNGKIFSASVNITNLLTLNSHTINVSNPIGTGKNLYLSHFIIASTGSTNFNLIISLIKGGTLSSATTIKAINNNCGSLNSSVSYCSQNSSVGSGGNIIFQDKQNTLSYTKNFNSSICVPPNSNFLLSVQNPIVSSSESISIIIYWYEI